MANTFTPRNPLGDVLSEDGISRNEAAAEAHANLEHLRDESMAELDRTLQLMAEVAPQIAAVDDPQAAELYAAANRVVAIAGVFSLHELSGHAYELCEAISRMQEAGVWKSDVTQDFMQALQDARAD
jgi:hypothetical protein